MRRTPDAAQYSPMRDDEAGWDAGGGRVANDLLLVEAHEMREYELRVCTQ